MKYIKIGLGLIASVGMVVLAVGCSDKEEHTAKTITNKCHITRIFSGHKQHFHFEDYQSDCSMVGRWGSPNGYWEDVK